MLLRLAIILVTVLIGSEAAAISPFAPRGKGNNGFKIGIISATNVDIGTDEFQSDVNVSLGVFFEVPVYRSIWSGVAVDLHNTTVLDQQQIFLNVSIPVKYRIKKSVRGLATLIGVAPGFGHLADITFLERTNYFTLTGSIELQFPQEKGRAWVTELGTFGTLTGGNRHHDVTIGPAFFLRIGYIL